MKIKTYNHLLTCLIITANTLILIGCGARVTVDPSIVDFGHDKTEATIKVWNASSTIVNRRMEFEVTSDEPWIIEFIPKRETSLDPNDKKEIKIIATRKNLSRGTHEGYITVYERAVPSNFFKVLAKITNLVPRGERIQTPDLQAILTSINPELTTTSLSLQTFQTIQDKIKQRLLDDYGLILFINTILECNNSTPKDLFIKQEPKPNEFITQGEVLNLYFSSGPCED